MSQTSISGRSSGRASASPMWPKSNTGRTVRCWAASDSGRMALAETKFTSESPAAIRHPAEQRRREELHRREDEHEGTVADPLRPEPLGEDRQDRHDDSEPDQIDQDGQKDHAEAGAGRGHAGCNLADVTFVTMTAGCPVNVAPVVGSHL